MIFSNLQNFNKPACSIKFTLAAQNKLKFTIVFVIKPVISGIRQT